MEVSLRRFLEGGSGVTVGFGAVVAALSGAEDGWVAGGCRAVTGLRGPHPASTVATPNT